MKGVVELELEVVIYAHEAEVDLEEGPDLWGVVGEL